MKLAIVLKGYPRLSETFIAQEILALERAGYSIEIWSLRQPTDKYLHPMHRQIVAPRFYLPEYLHDAPLRVLRAFIRAMRRPRFGAMFSAFWADFRRDFTPNRLRRLGQACVLAAELDPAIRHIHVHFLHTPASVVRYACLLTGRSFSFSAHAKDVWTIPDWERREKIAQARFGATCTRDSFDELSRLALPGDRGKLHLLYHGLDLARFPPPPTRHAPDPAAPIRIVSVGRAVEKKGYDDVLEALAGLPKALSWRFVHIGSGPLIDRLKAKAKSLAIADRIEWRGGLPQERVIEALADADLFVLASKPGADGDRDGLPNVLMEGATQKLPLLSTRFAGVPEFIRDGEEGLLVPPGDVAALAAALARLIGDGALRQRLGEAAYSRVRNDFSFDAGIARLDQLLREAQAAAKVAEPA